MLRRAGVARDLAQVVGGKLASFGSFFLSGILVARATGPAEYGLFAAALSVAQLLDAIVGTPLDWASIRFGALHRGETGRVHRILAATFRLKLLLGTVALIAVLPAAPAVTRLFFPSGEHTTLLVVALASTLPLLALRGTSAFLQVELRFDRYARVDVLQGVLRLCVVSLLFLGGAHAAVVYLGVQGTAAALAFLVALWLVPQPYLHASWPGRSDLIAMLSYGSLTAASIVLGTITARTDVLILAAVRPPAEVGQYGAALQVPFVATLLAGFAGIVIQPRIIAFARQGRLASLLGWNFGLGILIGVPAAVAAVWLCPFVVPVLFGARYAPAVPVLQVLVVATSLDLISIPVLLPAVVQLFPRATFVSELFTTIAFFLAAPLAAAAAGGVGLAWVVAGIRTAKLLLYLGITLANLGAVREDAARLAPPVGEAASV